MNGIRRVVLSICVLVAVWAARGIAIEETDLVQCGQLLRAPEPKSSAYVERKYAPDRVVDILHVAIDVTPNFKARTIKGVTRIRFAPIARRGRSEYEVALLLR